jgi:hypothetical protein
MKPWAYGPFEVLLHGETHYRLTEDLDRRIAMVGFDNAIELSITTYLTLNPMQRGNRHYPKGEVQKCLENFHTRLEFFFNECKTRSIVAASKRDELIWYHDVRNEQYHGGGATIPQRRELDGVRDAALEVFSILFEENAVMLLEKHIAAMAPPPVPPRNDEHDRLIDSEYDMVEVCGQPEYVSNLLYALDPNRYREVALELQQAVKTAEAEERS